MARLKVIQLRRSWQDKTYRYVRRVLLERNRMKGVTGGIVLADGVGLGKTYEALAAVATMLAQGEHFKERKKRAAFRIVAVVPPGLVTKWADELLLPDRFPRYVTRWSSPATRAVARTFRDVVILRRKSDLCGLRGQRRYGLDVLPPGFYVVNVNLVTKEGRKYTQLRNTRWDAIIIDEAHRICSDVLDSAPRILSGPKAATILLTATPFQLSPQEMKGLFAATFSGRGGPGDWEEKADDLWEDHDFAAFRRSVRRFFETGDESDVREARSKRARVRELLLDRMVRNRPKEVRRYHVVDQEGRRRPILGDGDPFSLDDQELHRFLQEQRLIKLDEKTATTYLEVRSRLAKACAWAADSRRPFVAGTLRQLLSSYSQFRKSRFGKKVGGNLPPDERHPKLAAAMELVARIVRDEVRRAPEQGWIGKVLVFATYVGAEIGSEIPEGESAHGTAALLKQRLERRLRQMSSLRRATRKERHRVAAVLQRAVGTQGRSLEETEKRQLMHRIRRFAGTPAARLVGSTRPSHPWCSWQAPWHKKALISSATAATSSTMTLSGTPLSWSSEKAA